LVELKKLPDGRRRFRVMEDEPEEQHEENENRVPPTPLNPERSGCSPVVERTSSPLRRRQLSGLKTTPIWMISTRWILVLQLIRFRNDPQVQFFLNEPFLASHPAILRIRATSGTLCRFCATPTSPAVFSLPSQFVLLALRECPRILARLRRETGRTSRATSCANWSTVKRMRAGQT
jgi:hypothetical protein